MKRRPGYSVDALYSDVLNNSPPPEPATDGDCNRQNLPSKNGGKNSRQNITANSDGEILRQNLTVENDGAARVHKIKPERHRVELRLDDDLYARLTAEAKGAGVTINGAAKQIFNIYFNGKG